MRKSNSNIRISEIIYRHLNGTISGDEKEMLECWLKNEDNAAFFMELKNTDLICAGLSEMQGVDTDKHFRQLQEKMNRQKYLKLWKIAGGIAAVLVLSIGAAWFWNNDTYKPASSICSSMYLPQEEDQTILQTVGGQTIVFPDTTRRVREIQKHEKQEIPVQRKDPGFSPLNVLNTSSKGSIEVTLCDNTRVWLNASSTLKYPNEFQGKQRNVYLDGEAYFEVVKNTAHPFVVHTQKAEIEVLGTHFNVNVSQESPCVTTLVEGCVKVKGRKKDSVIIYPGQQVVAHDMGEMEVRMVNTRFYTAWHRNFFAFQDETFYHIMNILAGWYDFTFEFDSVGLANLKFTTTIQRYEHVDDVLEILQRTGSFAFVKGGGGNIEIKKE